MEEGAEVGKLGTHDDFVTVFIIFLIFRNEGGEVVVGGDHDRVVTVVLHDFKYLNLVSA